MKGNLKVLRKSKLNKDGKKAAIILAPMILWWLAAAGFPLMFGFLLGFFEWKGIAAQPKWIWFGNFVTFFTSSKYMSILWRTVWLGVASTALTIFCGFGVALLMNLPLKFRGVFRSFWYVPAVVSTVAVSQVIALLIDPFKGALTIWFNKNGWTPINFVDSAGWGYVVIIIYSVWKGVGGSALLWLAGLQCIDGQLYEAAKVDGAGSVKRFFHITIPGLRPIFVFIIITGMIGALQIYEPVAMITNGGPVGGTMVLALQIITDGFFNQNFGMAGASSLVLAVIIFASSASFYIYSRRKNRNA